MGQRWGGSEGIGRIEPLGAMTVTSPPARRAKTP